MNRAEIAGRLTKDIELRKTPNGNSVTTFTLAVKDVKDTQFINCVAWNGSADYLNSYAHKGDWVIVEGKLRNRSYDTQTGKRYVTEVYADSVQLISTQKKEDPEQDNQEQDVWNTEETPW